MARVETKSAPKRKPILESLPFNKSNYTILGAGLLSIVLGYVALAQPPWDGTMPLVVAPILLVLGYCVLIPLGILYRRKAAPETTQPPQTKG
jgi:uncharacterized membrane protein HdeD (DUF308 family)